MRNKFLRVHYCGTVKTVVCPAVRTIHSIVHPDGHSTVIVIEYESGMTEYADSIEFINEEVRK